MRTPGDDPTRGRGRRMAVVLVAVGLAVAGCAPDTLKADPGEKVVPAKVEKIAGKDVKKVTLTEQAAKRLGVQTVTVATAPGSPGGQASAQTTVVPYAAVLYAPDGTTWVYTVTQPLTYVREKVAIATVGGARGDEAVLSAGPPAGTTVVSTGVIEIYGAELGVGAK